MSTVNTPKSREGYLDAIMKLIAYIALFIVISIILQILINAILPRYGIFIGGYYVYINVTLTLIIGFFIVRAFSNVMYQFIGLKYQEDVARAFRNLFLVIGIGALITVVAGEVGGGLAGVSVGGFLGIVIGFAMQGPLGMAVSGLFLLISRPFKISDYVTILGDTGTVKDVGILFTEIMKDDGTKVVIPSNLIIGNKVYIIPRPVPVQSQPSSGQAP